jgi:hypothetical protein
MRIDWDVPVTMHDGLVLDAGPLPHKDAHDPPPEIFGRPVTLHSEPARPAHVLLPVIPAQR